MADDNTFLGMDDAAAQVMHQNTQATVAQIKNNVGFAVNANPDTEAKLQSLSRTSGVPVDTVRAMPEEIRQQTASQQFDADAVAKGYPHLAQFMTSLDNTKLIHDDVPVTAKVEAATKALPPVPVAAATGVSTPSTTFGDAVHYIFSTPGDGDTLMGDLGRGFGAFARGSVPLAKGISLAGSTVLQRPLDAVFGTHYQEGLFQNISEMEKAADDTAPGKDAGFRRRLVETVGNTSAILSQAIATGGEAPVAKAGATMLEALTPMFQHGVKSMMVPSSVAAEDTYQKVYDQTGSVTAATKAGLAAYATNTLSGLIPFSKPGSLAVRMTTGALMGPITGAVNHDLMNAAMPDSMQAPARTGEDVALDAVMGTMFGGIGGHKDLADINMRLSEAARQTYIDAVHSDAAIKSTGALSGLGQISAVAKLRGRDPAAFKAFVDSVTDDGVAKDVYVDAKVLTDALAKEGVTHTDLEQAIPGLSDRLHEALVTKGDVRMPVADYATYIAGTPIDDAILPHLKTDPDGKTYAEAQVFYQDQVESLKAAVERIVEGVGERPKPLSVELGKDHQVDVPNNQVVNGVRVPTTDTADRRYDFNPTDSTLSKMSTGPDGKPLLEILHAIGGDAAQHDWRSPDTVRPGDVPVAFPDALAARDFAQMDLPADAMTRGTGEARDQAYQGRLVDNIKQQLDQVNVYRPEVNRLHAELQANEMAVAAGRAGIPLEQFVQRYPLDVNKVALGEGLAQNGKTWENANSGAPNETATQGTLNQPGNPAAVGDARHAALNELRTAGVPAYSPAGRPGPDGQGSSGQGNGRGVRLRLGENGDAEAGGPGSSAAAGPADTGVSGGLQSNGGSARLRLVDGSETQALGTYTVNPEAAEKLHAAGIATPPIHEVDPAQHAQAFADSISGSRENNPFGASVYVYPAGEYAGMRLFMVDGGKAGFALKGDDIVSVFNYDAAQKGAADAMLALAVELGGRRLDAFDTVLPGIYARHGFVAVARTKWNDAYAPEGWNKQTYQTYNNGEPDVVFMAHDPASAQAYVPGEGRVFTDYDEAVAAQQAALATVAGGDTLRQDKRGQIQFGQDITAQPSLITLLKGADYSTYQPELGHYFLEVYTHLAGQIEAKAAAGETLTAGESGIQADMQAVMDYLKVAAPDGLTQLQHWASMSLADKTEAHETWARSREAYLMEGKAPSVKLTPVMAAFSRFMTMVYKTLDRLGVKLTPEVRQVMDRMLATQDAIDEAQAVRGYKSLFETAEAAGMTPEEFGQYQKLGQQSTDEALVSMQARSLRDMQWLSNAKSRALRELQQQAYAARKTVREAVTAEVDRTPAFAAKRFLDTATDPLAGHKQEVADWKELRDATPADKREEWTAANPMPEKPRTDLDGWKDKRSAAEASAFEEERAKIGEGLKGLARGQELARNKKLIDNRVDAKMLDWEKANPEPVVDRPKVDMQVVADKFGYDTPEAMLQAIHDAGSRKDTIDGMTDQRMLEQHGDLIDKPSMERAAEAAIHNEARARFMATGLKALVKTSTPAAMIHEAARQAAAGAVNARQIKELRPAQYAAAEARANKDALKLAPKDTQGAIDAQRAALLNNQLFKHTTDAMDMVKKGLDYLKKFDRPKVREKLDGAFLERIDQLKAAMDLRNSPPTANVHQESLATWAEGLRELGYEPQIADWLNDLATPMHFKDATVDQFRAVVDGVKSLEHIAREMKLITIDGKKIAVEEAVNALKARMEERGARFTKAELLERPTAKIDGTWKALTNWIGVHLRMVHGDLLGPEFKFNKFDMHELAGPFRKMILDPVLAGNYRKVDMTRRQSQAMAKMGDALGKEWQRSLYDAVANPRLVDPDLSTPTSQVMMKMTRGRMLGIARHVGNESNFEKLTKGYGWDGKDVWAFLQANMTKKDWQATQAHWDSFDPLWKEAEALIRRQGGVPPPKIPARPFEMETRNVIGDNTANEKMQLSGGYSPIDYDPLRSKLAVRHGEFDLGPGDKIAEQVNYRATTTSNSSMVSRMQGYSDRVNLDFHSADSRIRDTIHDLAYREALLDVGKIVNDGSFRSQFMQTYGREEYAAITDWLKGVRDMNSRETQSRGFEKAMQYGRQGVVLTGIGYRMSTVLKHGSSAALKSLGYLGNGEGAKYFAARVFRMTTGHLQEELNGARDKFPEIRARMQQMDRDLSAGNRSMYEAEGWREKNNRYGHAFVAWSDAFSAVPTAWAAYDLAINSGVSKKNGGTGLPMSEHDAVLYANSVVRQAHGSALESARSNFMAENGKMGSAKGFFGALYGFMNNTYGQMHDLLDKSVSNGYFRNNPAVAARLTATLLMPALMAQWVKDSGPDHDEHWYTWAAKALAGEVGGMVPFVRDAVSWFEYGRGPQTAPSQILSDAYHSATDMWGELHGKQTRILQDLANTVGELAHIGGFGQLGHIMQYMRDSANGKKHEDGLPLEVKAAVVGGKPAK